MSMTILLSLAAGVCLGRITYIVVVVLATEYHNYKVRKMARTTPDRCVCGAPLDENGWCGDRNHATLIVRDLVLLAQLKPYGQPLK